MNQTKRQTIKNELKNELKLIVQVSIVLMLLTQFASAEDWFMFRHDLNHAGETSDVIENPEKLDFMWKFKSGDRVVSSPSVAGNYIYVGSDGYIYAFASLKPVNSSCTQNLECKTKNCFRDKICKPQGFCFGTYDCLPDHYCVNNICEPLKPTNSSCSESRECKTKNCFNGICKEPGYCENGLCCPSDQKCFNGLCKPKWYCKENSDCTPDQYCFANICKNPKSLLALCLNNSECESDNCFRGVCREHGYIEPFLFLIPLFSVFLIILILFLLK